jgi:uncharacterized protein YjbI with pentapeptide repeats
MKLHGVKECLDVHDSDISGSVYDDVNMSGSTVGNVNLAGCSFTNVNLSGATFEDANLSGWKLPRREPCRSEDHESQSGRSLDFAGALGGNDDRGHSCQRSAGRLPREPVRRR